MWWSDLYGERILYLHIHLLGFISLGIIAAAHQIIGGSSRAQRFWMNLAVSLVVLSLLPLTTFWPKGLRGSWILFEMAWLALLPVGFSLWLAIKPGIETFGRDKYEAASVTKS